MTGVGIVSLLSGMTGVGIVSLLSGMTSGTLIFYSLEKIRIHLRVIPRAG